MVLIFLGLWFAIVFEMYSQIDIFKAYEKLNISEDSNLLIKSDLRYLGVFEDKIFKNDFVTAHKDTLFKIISKKKGNIAVSTASDSLCNTKILFDIKNTKSERGVFSEIVRKDKSTKRSLHPFLSYSVYGKDGDFITKNVSRHGYGPNTPKSRMYDLNFHYISVGLPPRLTCSFIHHVEMIMGVPYRYTKEFIHPILVKNEVLNENFYMYLCYLEIDILRDRNKKLFEYCKKKGLEIKETKLGGGTIYKYSCKDFVDCSIDFLTKDIYGWLEKPPLVRPYIK